MNTMAAWTTIGVRVPGCQYALSVTATAAMSAAKRNVLTLGAGSMECVYTAHG